MGLVIALLNTLIHMTVVTYQVGTNYFMSSLRKLGLFIFDSNKKDSIIDWYLSLRFTITML